MPPNRRPCAPRRKGQPAPAAPAQRLRCCSPQSAVPPWTRCWLTSASPRSRCGACRALRTISRAALATIGTKAARDNPLVRPIAAGQGRRAAPVWRAGAQRSRGAGGAAAAAAPGLPAQVRSHAALELQKPCATHCCGGATCRPLPPCAQRGGAPAARRLQGPPGVAGRSGAVHASGGPRLCGPSPPEGFPAIGTFTAFIRFTQKAVYCILSPSGRPACMPLRR